MSEADKMITTGAAARLPTPPSQPDAALVQWCEEALAARRAYNATQPPHDDTDGPAFRRMIEAEAQASTLPATTMEGVLALARLARDLGDDSPFPGRVVESLLALGDGAAVMS